MYTNFLTVFFSIILIFSCLMVILLNNAIYSVFYLILSFIAATGILLILESEFMALIFLVIYIGAIAVLFLFVIMMLNVKTINSIKNFLKYFPITNILGFIFFFIILFTILKSFPKNPYAVNELNNYYINWFDILDSIIDTKALGQILYTHYVFQFLIVGIILFIAILGSVVLTLNNKKFNFKKQEIFKQITR